MRHHVRRRPTIAPSRCSACPPPDAIEVNNLDFARISSAGRTAERWGGLDMFSLLTQLGAIPAPTEYDYAHANLS